MFLPATAYDECQAATDHKTIYPAGSEAIQEVSADVVGPKSETKDYNCCRQDDGYPEKAAQITHPKDKKRPDEIKLLFYR